MAGNLCQHVADQDAERVLGRVGQDREIVLTSGGTEADNLALRGSLERSRDRRVLVTDRLEHSAVRETAQTLAEQGTEVLWLDVDARGLVDLDALTDLLADRADEIAVVSVMWANNETGTIQPIRAIADAVAEAREAAPGRARVYLHADACQAVGKLAVDAEASGVDLLSLSGHKLHGPKGVGALYVRRGLRLRRQVHGGPQELQRRGGTENTAGIVGFGVAARLAREELARMPALAALRDRLEARLRRAISDAVVFGDRVPRLPNTSCLAVPGLRSETQVMALDLAGLAVSAGSACSSGKVEPSHVLTAMGSGAEMAAAAIRVSFGWNSRREDVTGFLQAWSQFYRRIQAA